MNMNERELGRLAVVVETFGGASSWGDPAWAFSLGLALGLGRALGGVCRGGDWVLRSCPRSGEGGSREGLVSGEAGPRGEQPGAVGRASHSAGRSSGTRGCELRRPERRGAGAALARLLRPTLGARLGVPGAGDASARRSRLLRGRPCWSLGSKVGASWRSQRRGGGSEEQRRLERGVSRDAMRSSVLGFPTKGSLKLSPGRRGDKAREKGKRVCIRGMESISAMRM